ncbi:MAG: DUF362 domain-containing protein [Proteobacteria bacterium]|nr:DUF362 domain-containing protein [Pseudomonadota bacterium]
MSKLVSIVRYEKPLESVRKAIDLCHGLDHLPSKAKVYIKPNIVIWNTLVKFPKWGVITTSRVIEDVVVLLKERGIDDITIGEGIVTKAKDTETPAHAFESLGYNTLNKRYGVKAINVFEREFEEVDVGDGDILRFNADILHSDFVVDIPVLKTHAQTAVTLGIKNLKGMIDIDSRKKSHGADPVKNLNYYVAKLYEPMPPMLVLLDGIYTNALGPSFDGRLKRSNILVASSDILSADLVGAKVLGIDPTEAQHLVNAAANQGRPHDLSDVEVVGETIESVASRHEHAFPYSEDGSLPLPFAKMGVQGLAYYKYDLSMCTYCAGLNVVALQAIASAWKGEPFDDIEVLTGKAMQPQGRKKTILLGKCMCDLHKDNPNIQEKIEVKGCPPAPQVLIKAMHKAGIMVDPAVFQNMDKAPGLYMKRYEGKPEYDESFYTVS